MRLEEFASAEEQLALWRLISDNTWLAINQQAEAERMQSAARAAQTKSKPKRTGGKRGGRKNLALPTRFTQPPPQAKAETPVNAPQQLAGSTRHANAAAAPAKPSSTQAAATLAPQQTPTQPSTPVQQPSAMATGVQQATAANAEVATAAKPKPNMPQGSTLLARAKGVVDNEF